MHRRHRQRSYRCFQYLSSPAYYRPPRALRSLLSHAPRLCKPGLSDNTADLCFHLGAIGTLYEEA